MSFFGYIISYLADIGIVIRRSPEKLQPGKTRKFYGRVNTWASDKKSNLRKDLIACYANGINGYHIELASWGGDASVWESSSRIKNVKKRYEWLVDQCRALGLYLFVSVVNDNMGKGKYGDTGPKLEQVYDQAIDLANFVKKCGKKNVLVQPVAETQTSAGKRFDAYCIGALNEFELVNNSSGGRPATTNGMKYRAWHPASIAAIRQIKGASNCIISSDHGLLIREISYGLDGKLKPEQMKPFYQACKDIGALCCCFYAFLYKGHDDKGIKAFGKA